jgi:coenzyme F420-reducing hydrogenase gamma subunit/tRNA A-37 threonylcarbamoyl transferase component Bud32
MSLKNDYLIEELIGSGAMATISRGVQKSLDRRVAIKRIHPHLAESPEFVDRFAREAKASANLKHVNIMDIIDYGGDEKDGYFIVMEYVDGPTLAKLMRGPARIPLDVALSIAVQLLNGLEHAHNNGVIHRDIKPANIMLTRAGGVKIADFGIAIASKLPSLTRTGQKLGTPAYMSPEQAEGKKLDHRSDLFSVGIILYELLAGRPPFKGTETSVLREIVHCAPPPLDTVEPSIPPALAAIVAQALEKNVTNRFFDATEFEYSLETFAAGVGLRVGPRACQNFLRLFLESVATQEAAAAAQTQAKPAHQTTKMGKTLPTVGILPLQGCFGCQLNMLDLHEKLVDVLKLVDVRFSYLMDVKEMPELDIGFVEGAVGNVDNEEKLKAFRGKCKKLVALGTCASFGGIPGLRNLHPMQEVVARAYGPANGFGGPPDPAQVPALTKHVRAVPDVVPVDAIIPGCPSPRDLLVQSITALVEGSSLKIPTHNLCTQCKRRHKAMLVPKRAFVSDDVRATMELSTIDPDLCFLEQGVLCLGLATREGCGSRCTSYNAPCQGCMGPPPKVRETGAKWIDALGSLLPGGALRYRHDLVGTSYRYTLPTSIMPHRMDEED